MLGTGYAGPIGPSNTELVNPLADGGVLGEDLGTEDRPVDDRLFALFQVCLGSR